MNCNCSKKIVPNETLNVTKKWMLQEGKYPMLPQPVATALTVPTVLGHTSMPSFIEEDERLFLSKILWMEKSFLECQQAYG